jgi:hypothetical protein
VVGPPPTPDSPRGKADRGRFNETRKLVNTPTWTQAIADADLTGREGFKSFSCAAGVTISPEATPTLTRMLLRMTSDASTIYRPAKSVYQRPRPPVGNTKPICVPREAWIDTDGSYPSGHGLIGWSWALVISEVAPDKASQILARGRAFGDSRIICGVHFQSDIEAGRYLGSAMVSRCTTTRRSRRTWRRRRRRWRRPERRARRRDVALHRPQTFSHTKLVIPDGVADPGPRGQRIAVALGPDSPLRCGRDDKLFCFP